jgi:hypothetical protein
MSDDLGLGLALKIMGCFIIIGVVIVVVIAFLIGLAIGA